MSRYTWLVGGVVVVVLAVFALAPVVLAGTAPDRDRQDRRTGHVEYTVASAAGAEAATLAAPAIAVPTVRHRGMPAIPDTLTLLVVGSLLIGLAAAVRRTT